MKEKELKEVKEAKEGRQDSQRWREVRGEGGLHLINTGENSTP
jgi:hypothetical protein